MIVTSRDESAEKVHQRLIPTGIVELVEHIETRTELSLEWHNKCPQIKTVLSKFGAKVENCFLAGDVPPDIESGRRSNLGATYGLLSGGIKKEVLEAAKPDQILRSVANLPEILA